MSSIDRVAVFDLETTGTDVENDRIVTAFVGVVNRNGVVSNGITWLLDPGVDIPEGASDVHGVTTEFAREHGMNARMGVKEIASAITTAVKSMPLVVYNAPFDPTLLDRELRRHWEYKGTAKFSQVIDPFVIDKHLDPYRKGKRTLGVVADQYGIDLGANAHDAEADCYAAGMLAFKLVDLVGLKPTDLHRRQIEWKKKQSEGLQKHFRKTDPTAVVDPSWPIRDYKEETA